MKTKNLSAPSSRFQLKYAAISALSPYLLATLLLLVGPQTGWIV